MIIIMASSWNIEQTSCSDLMDLPVKARDVDKRVASAVAARARKDVTLIKPVIVAKVGSISYVVNDFETIMGLDEAGVSTIQTCIFDYHTVKEVVMEHMRTCLFPYVVNPLRIHDVVEYLLDHDMHRIEIDKMLKNNLHHELIKVLNCHITSEARAILQDMMNQILKKRYLADIKAYYITKISKIREDRQSDAAHDIANMTLENLGINNAFSWLSVKRVDFILENYSRIGKNVDDC